MLSRIQSNDSLAAGETIARFKKLDNCSEESADFGHCPTVLRPLRTRAKRSSLDVSDGL